MKVIKQMVNSGAYFLGKCAGFSNSYAVEHIRRLVSDYLKSGIKRCFHVHKWHKRGFYAGTAEKLQLTDSNYKDYLCDFDYRKLHPINGPYSVWIDDKLTFRHIFARYSEHIPKYYFHSDQNGNLLDCVDLPEKYRSQPNKAAVFLELLREKGRLFGKPSIGSLSKGALLFAYQNGKYFVARCKMNLQ